VLVDCSGTRMLRSGLGHCKEEMYQYISFLLVQQCTLLSGARVPRRHYSDVYQSRYCLGVRLVGIPRSCPIVSIV
jgi:hypothetical protein